MKQTGGYREGPTIVGCFIRRSRKVFEGLAIYHFESSNLVFESVRKASKKAYCTGQPHRLLEQEQRRVYWSVSYLIYSLRDSSLSLTDLIAFIISADKIPASH